MTTSLFGWRRKTENAQVERTAPIVAPPPHPSGDPMPDTPADRVPQHVAIVMDGNGRWANQRGLPRTEGHVAGELAMMDVLAGAIERGVRHLSVYAFSTENWRRSPEEVRFLMKFNRETIRKHRNLMHDWGVEVRWVGRRQRLWSTVVHELRVAEKITRGNDVITLRMCVNYGGVAEIADAARALAVDVVDGKLDPGKIDESTLTQYMYDPEVPKVDLFIRTSGEQRTSNFLLWQSAYAELVFSDKLWPDFDRRDLWAAVDEYAGRDRRLGGATDAPKTSG